MQNLCMWDCSIELTNTKIPTSQAYLLSFWPTSVPVGAPRYSSVDQEKLFTYEVEMGGSTYTITSPTYFCSAVHNSELSEPGGGRRGRQPFPPRFWQSVNPISTGGGADYGHKFTNYPLPLRIFRPSYGPAHGQRVCHLHTQ